MYSCEIEANLTDATKAEAEAAFAAMGITVEVGIVDYSAEEDYATKVALSASAVVALACLF